LRFFVIIDTNVVISAMFSRNPSSPVRKVFALIDEGIVVPVFSDVTFKEYIEVSHRSKFGFPIDLVEQVLFKIMKAGIKINPPHINIELPDQKDLPFYEIAMETRRVNSQLVTGNQKHFPHAKYIMTPREFIDLVEKMKTGH